MITWAFSLVSSPSISNFFRKTTLLYITFLPLGISITSYVFISFNDCNSERIASVYLGASSFIASCIEIVPNWSVRASLRVVSSLYIWTVFTSVYCIIESGNTVLFGTLPYLVSLITNEVSSGPSTTLCLIHGLNSAVQRPLFLALILNRPVRELIDRLSVL